MSLSPATESWCLEVGTALLKLAATVHEHGEEPSDQDYADLARRHCAHIPNPIMTQPTRPHQNTGSPDPSHPLPINSLEDLHRNPDDPNHPEKSPAGATYTAADFLTTARDTLLSRAKERGLKSERSMDRCVSAFNAMTGHQLTEVEGHLFMVFLKMARSKTGTVFNPDDYIDGQAYLALAAQSAQAEQTPDQPGINQEATKEKRKPIGDCKTPA